jgi:hypothetical protein
MKKTLSLFVLVVLSTSFKLNIPSIEPTPLKIGFIVNPISFIAAKNRIGASIKFSTKELTDFERLPQEFQLADLTGYLITIYKSDKQFSTISKLLRENGYTSMPSLDNQNNFYFIPNAFYGSSLEVDSFLDGKAADEFIDYFDQWYFLKVKLDTLIIENNKSLEDLTNRNINLQAINSKITTTEEDILKADREIKDLEGEIQIVNSMIDDPSAYLDRSRSFAPEGLTEREFLLRRSLRVPIPYNPNDDFMRQVLQNNCVSIAGKPYDSPQITNKYFHKDLVAALDKLVSNEQDMQALRDMGLAPFKLASAGRTPLQQASVGSQNPVAAGMFSSGHIFCSAGDIAFAGTSYNDGISHSKLRDILAKHGISLPDNLSKIDPNHFFLGTYTSNKTFANNLRIQMLGSYYNAMVNERNVQLAKRDKLGGEQASISSKIQKLNDMIKTAQGQLDKLNKQKDSKETTKKDKQKELNRSKDALAAKIEAERKARDRRNPREAEKNRERWGQGSRDSPDKNNYWDRYSNREFHASDGNRDCWGRETTRENTRTGEWERERHIECSGRAENQGGFNRLP